MTDTYELPKPKGSSAGKRVAQARASSLCRQITAEQVREELNYDPITGAFTRRRNGEPAGANCKDGYRRIWVAGRSRREHVIAWLHFYGELPAVDVDHVDTNRANNAIANLRLATAAQNSQNRRVATTSRRSGTLLGTSLLPSGKWRAQIGVNYTTLYLGQFNTEEEAHAVYLHAKARIHAFSTQRTPESTAPQRLVRAPSGIKGVGFHKSTGKWRARINKKHIGTFDTIEEAAAAIRTG